MRIKPFLLIMISSTFLFNQSLMAKKEIKVGLEPFPPLINENGTGYSIDMLKAIESVSDLSFNIQIMPYVRAKNELKEGKLDLIGHTPYQKETKDFYQYAEDINWSITAITDIFGMDEQTIGANNIKSLKQIGTPFGNKEFYSDIFQIPVAKFHEGDLNSLLKMLESKRIDAIIFERASTMTTIKQLQMKNVFYRTMDDSIKASFAVKKSKDGADLKNQLSKSIEKLDSEKIFSNYNKYIKMPKNGKIQ